MLRKLLIGVVASLAVFAPFAVPAQADAHQPVAVHPHHHTYRVYYRVSCNAPWRLAGSFRHREDAFREAHFLRHRGFETMVR